MVVRITVTPQGTVQHGVGPATTGAPPPPSPSPGPLLNPTEEPDELPGTDAELDALFEEDERRRMDREDDLEPAMRDRHKQQSQFGDFLKTVEPYVPDLGGLLIGMANAQTLDGNKVAEGEAKRAKSRAAWLDAVQSTAKDVGTGIIETPRQMIGGARDAVQAAVNGIGAVGDWLNENVADLGTLQLLDDQGNLSPALKPSAKKAEMPQLPTVKKADSTTGGVVRSVTQFLTGFVGAGKALGLAGRTTAGGAAAKGAMSDLAAFDAHEERLSDLIQSVPALANPITELLAHKGDEGEIEGRFKRAVEGLGLGIAAEGLIRGIRAVKAARAARTEVAAAEEEATRGAAAAQQQPREAVPMTLLGDSSDQAKAFGRIDTTGIPDDVVARALTAKGLTPLKATEPPIARFRVIAKEIENRLPAVEDGFTRLWRGNRPDEIGTATSFTNDLPGIALPFQKAYRGKISYVDVPTSDLARFENKVGTARGAEFSVPADIARGAKTVPPVYGSITSVDGQPDLFINFARINSEDDVKRVMADMANAVKEDIDAGRRGVRSNPDTIEAAQKLDAWDIISSRRVGEPLNAEQSVAARGLWEASGRKLMEVAETASSQPSPENLFQFRKMLATHAAIQQEVIAARTETARALQSWKIPAGGTREQMAAIDDVVGKMGGLDVNAALAARVAALKNVPNGLAALDEVVSKSLFARSLDAVKETWIMALLSGPKTHMVNMMSNSAVAAQQIVERATAARVGQILGGGDVQIGEAAAQWFGMQSGLRDAFRYAFKTFKTGESGYGLGKLEIPFQRAVSAEAFNRDPQSWMGRAIDTLGTVVNLPGRALLAEDEFFKTIGHRMELHAQAFRTASREVMDGRISQAELKGRIADIVANPPENMRLAAADAAAYQTFTNATGPLVQALNRLETRWGESGPGGQLGATLLRMTIPFRNTPANIFKYTFERTPLAPLTERYRNAIAQGGAEAEIARTRMALGTMTILLATDLAMDGHLTGGGPNKNERGERDALFRSGWQPYSAKVGDRYFAFNRMDPVGFTLGMGADLGEFINDNKFDESTGVALQKAISAAGFSVGNNALNKNYLRGISDFVGALQEPDRQGTRWLSKMVGAFVPTGAAEVARAIDPYMRATHDIISQIRSRTPGLSEDLPLMRDLWGRPKSLASGLGTAYDAISPIYSKREQIEPIDQVMFDDAWFLSPPNRRVGNVSLTNHPEAFSRYLELRGQTKPTELGDARLLRTYGDQTLLDTLNSVVTGNHRLSGDYKKLDDGDDRQKFVKKIVAAYGRAARNRLKEEFPKVFEDKDGGGEDE